MKQLQVTSALVNFFDAAPDTLIFAGYCRNADGVTVYNDGNSYALVADVNGACECCIKSDSADFVRQFVSGVCGKVKFCGVSPFVTRLLSDAYLFNWKTECYLYVWNGQPLCCAPDSAIRPLDKRYAQAVSDGTPYHADVDDVRRCLDRHPSAALYIDGKPVCWCLLHLEQSLGMLYTLPEHRHKGYALRVMTALCNKVIASGNTPFAYIIKDNVASQNLALKYNLRRIGEANYFEIDLP